MRIALLVLLAAALTGCASDRYVCFPPSTCRRSEAMWKWLGKLECLDDQMKALMERYSRPK